MAVADLLIRAGRIIDPADGVDEIGAIWVKNGVIAARGDAVGFDPSAIRQIDARGLIVCPGFIDLHTHLRFPGFPDKETMQSGTVAAAAGGFTTVCAMANTDPVVDSADVLRAVLDEAARLSPVRVHQLGAVTLGLQGKKLTNLRALARAGAVAFSDDGKPVLDREIMREALLTARNLGMVISVHEEDAGMGVANAGPHALRLGLPEWPCRGESCMVERDLALLAETGGRLHIAHVSCAETVAVLRKARAEGLPITVEVTPHHLRLSDVLLEGDEQLGLSPAHPCVKVNPPLRSPEDVEAMIEALADGTIDAVATDHAPHAAADKARPFAEAAFGFTGIELALPLLLDLVRAGRMEISTVVERLTAGPARVFGLPGGTLRPGSPADICIFDPDERWTLTPEALRSKGKNTPLLGSELRGRAHFSIVGGNIVFAASQRQ